MEEESHVSRTSREETSAGGLAVAERSQEPVVASCWVEYLAPARPVARAAPVDRDGDAPAYLVD
jgi:hypothetical protein